MCLQLKFKESGYLLQFWRNADHLLLYWQCQKRFWCEYFESHILREIFWEEYFERNILGEIFWEKYFERNILREADDFLHLVKEWLQQLKEPEIALLDKAFANKTFYQSDHLPAMSGLSMQSFHSESIILLSSISTELSSLRTIWYFETVSSPNPISYKQSARPKYDIPNTTHYAVHISVRVVITCNKTWEKDNICEQRPRNRERGCAV